MNRIQRSSRSGALLVCVLVCLGIATTIVMLSVRSSLQARRQMQHELQLEQTRWLLDAGISRAASQLRQQTDYQGETWQVKPALSSYPEASIAISVNTDGIPSQKKSVTVTARLGSDHASGPALSGPIQRSHTFQISVSDSTTSTNQ